MPPKGAEPMAGGIEEPPASGELATGFLPRRALRSILGFWSDIAIYSAALRVTVRCRATGMAAGGTLAA